MTKSQNTLLFLVLLPTLHATLRSHSEQSLRGFSKGTTFSCFAQDLSPNRFKRDGSLVWNNWDHRGKKCKRRNSESWEKEKYVRLETKISDFCSTLNDDIFRRVRDIDHVSIFGSEDEPQRLSERKMKNFMCEGKEAFGCKFCCFFEKRTCPIFWKVCGDLPKQV